MSNRLLTIPGYERAREGRHASSVGLYQFRGNSLNQPVLGDILEVARRRNGADCITGMLLYHDAIILQVREGGQDRVTAGFDRIAKDSRHVGCIVLQSEEGSGRTLAQWDKAFAPFAELQARDKEGFFELQTLKQSEKMPVAGDDLRTRIYIYGFFESFTDLPVS